jgi:thiosulfate/3-mercaptopyruvate sulfurtransferase
MLTSTATLAQHLNDPSWVIFDCRHDLMNEGRGEALYREAHIPGAHFAHLDVDLSGEKTGSNGRHPLPAPQAFIAFLSRHGVMHDSTIVAYDDVGGQFASRLWWLARWVGFTNVHLLDGGINQWKAEMRALSSDVPHVRPTALAGHADATMVISADELLPRLGSAGTTLIDARAAERYRGDVEPIDPVAGHIPHAKNRFYKENLNANLIFKSREEIANAFRELIGADDEMVIHQCGSGVTACANIFAMQYAGLPMSTLYAGSWSEWISDPTRPIVRGSASK